MVIDGQPVRLAYARPKDAVAGSSDRDRAGSGRGGATGLGSLALEQARAIASGQARPHPPPRGGAHVGPGGAAATERSRRAAVGGACGALRAKESIGGLLMH